MLVIFGQSQSAWISDSLMSIFKCLHHSQKGDWRLLCLLSWFLNWVFLQNSLNFLSWNFGYSVLLIENLCACWIFVGVIDASLIAFCHEVVFSLTCLVHLRIFLNFLEPFFHEENSLVILLMFHFCTAVFISGGGYLPLGE